MYQPSQADRWLKAVAGVGLALAVWSGASTLLALHEDVGLPAQVVNVRWAETSPEDRQRAEMDLGLIEAANQTEQSGPTRVYRLARRSTEDIRRIVSHPLVADTHHIDRRALRVDLDRPQMNAVLWWLLQTDRVPLIVWALVACGLLPLWWSRRSLRLVTADAGTVFGPAASARVVPLRRAEVIGAVLIGAVFLLPLLLYGPSDDEEVGLGIFSSQIYYGALFKGQWPFWLDALGFGTPMPIGQRLDFHPIFALGSLVSLRVALSAVWVVHVAIMAVYFLRLAVASGIRPPLRTMLLICYMVSAPSLGYFYGSDWVSVVVGWSLYPALIFYVRQLIRGEAEHDFWRASLRLGLLAGLWIVNSHPGYLPPLAGVLGVYVVASGPRMRAYASLGAAGVFAAAVASERIYFSISEMRLFPSSLPRATQPGYSLRDYASAAVVPLSPVDLDLRLPFIGVFLGLMAVAAVPVLFKGRDLHARACGLAFAAAVLLSLAPDGLMLPLRVFSGVWLSRDPMVLFGILAAGMVLQMALDAVSRRWALMLRLLLVLQFAQQGAILWASVGEFLAHRGRLQFYRHQEHAVGLARVLADRAGTFGSRLYVSEDVRTRLRGDQSADGVHVITDLAFLGLRPINAWFKGVSMDHLYPSEQLMHGLIGGQREVMENRALLDVLGINLVMVTDGTDPAPHGLLQVDRYQPSAGDTERSRRPFLLFANPDAWPTAVLTGLEARDMRLPLRPNCPHAGALCRDFERLARTRRPEPAVLEGHGDSYMARFAPADDERLLFLSLAYRPEFKARSKGLSLRVDRVAEGFVGVTVPHGVSEVEIAFVPRVRRVLAWLSGASLMALLAGFSIVSWHKRR